MGLSQKRLADRLEPYTEKASKKNKRHYDEKNIGKWERAHPKRYFKLTRYYIIIFIQIFAECLTFREAQTWADYLEYRIKRVDFPPDTPFKQSSCLSLTWNTDPPENFLFLNNHCYLSKIQQAHENQAHHVIQISGDIGLGKTSLANQIYYSNYVKTYFHYKLYLTNSLSWSLNEFIEQLYDYCCSSLLRNVSLAEKTDSLRQTLKAKPYFIVLDDCLIYNDEINHFLDVIRKFANPSVFLLICNNKLRDDIYHVKLRTWYENESCHFLEKCSEDYILPQHYKTLHVMTKGNPSFLKIMIAFVEDGLPVPFELSQLIDYAMPLKNKDIPWQVWYAFWQRIHDFANGRISLSHELRLTYELAKCAWRLGKWKKACTYYETTIKLAKTIGDDIRLAWAYSNLAYLDTEMCRWDKVENRTQYAMSIFIRHIEEGTANYPHAEHKNYHPVNNLAHTHNHLGVYFVRQYRFDEAEKQFNKALDLWRNEGSYLTQQCGAYINLGLLYHKKRMPQKSLEYLQAAINVIHLDSYDIIRGEIYENMAESHRQQGNFEVAINYCQDAMTIFQKAGVDLNLAFAWQTLGRIYLDQNNFSRSRQALKHAHDIFSNYDIYYAKIRIMIDLIQYARRLENQFLVQTYKQELKNIDCPPHVLDIILNGRVRQTRKIFKTSLVST